jgi:hypothetical protein
MFSRTTGRSLSYLRPPEPFVSVTLTVAVPTARLTVHVNE